MYADAAPFYDVIQSGRGRDAGTEAVLVLGELRRRTPSLTSLLDVGCGTGAHLPAFVEASLDVVGADPSPSMLALATERAPGAVLVEAGLPELDLGPGLGDRRFDAIVSLFSVIGYVTDPGDLAASVAAMAGRLRPGGCLLVEAWVEPELWIGSRASAEAVTTADGVAVSRTVVSDRDGPIASIHMRYVVATAAGEMTSIDEHHRLRLADPAELETAFTAAGLTFERLPHMLHPGRPVCVGVRR